MTDKPEYQCPTFEDSVLMAGREIRRVVSTSPGTDFAAEVVVQLLPHLPAELRERLLRAWNVDHLVESGAIEVHRTIYY